MKEKIYIGSYSNSIKVCELNNGKLEIINEIPNIEKPSYIHINENILYAVSETEVGGIAIFNIQGKEPQKIDFKIINQSLPCYITTNDKREYLLVANYGSGSAMMYKLNKNGTINQKKYNVQYPNANMHFADFIDNSIYIVDLGNDSIYNYNLEMELLDTIKLEAKSGPRHLAFSKDEKIMYVVTEMSNEIYVYQKQDKQFSLLQKTPTLIEDSIKSYAGAIKISKDNKNIYVTNRGHNSISVFAIQENKLELVQNISSYGKFPRDILLNESEEYVLVANQKSNNIVVYKRNLQNGMLIKLQNENIKLEGPSCLVRSGYEL